MVYSCVFRSDFSMPLLLNPLFKRKYIIILIRSISKILQIILLVVYLQGSYLNKPNHKGYLMTIRKTFYLVALLFVMPAFVSCMTNEGAWTDNSTTETSSGQYQDDGTVSK